MTSPWKLEQVILPLSCRKITQQESMHVPVLYTSQNTQFSATAKLKVPLSVKILPELEDPEFHQKHNLGRRSSPLWPHL